MKSNFFQTNLFGDKTVVWGQLPPCPFLVTCLLRVIKGRLHCSICIRRSITRCTYDYDEQSRTTERPDETVVDLQPTSTRTTTHDDGHTCTHARTHTDRCEVTVSVSHGCSTETTHGSHGRSQRGSWESYDPNLKV